MTRVLLSQKLPELGDRDNPRISSVNYSKDGCEGLESRSTNNDNFLVKSFCSFLILGFGYFWSSLAS